jgi:phosphohistidine swiveling domain-containing protein
MKIFCAAVLAVSCMPYSAAFTGPQVVNRSAQASKLNLHGKSDGESPSWVGPAAAVVTGLTVASQVAGASVGVPVPVNPVEIANGKTITMDTKWHHLGI